MYIRPYVADILTGESRTRAYIVSFLESYSGCTDEVPRSLWDRVMGRVNETDSSPYKNHHPQPGKNYIHRARKVPTGKNPDEYAWCQMADISQAISTLDQITRFALYYKYLYDYANESITLALGISSAREVGRVLDRGIDEIVAILDRLE